MPKVLPILVLNGPNLNMLGVREPKKYGRDTLHDAEVLCAQTAKELGTTVDCRHSNSEGDLVTWIQESRKTHAGIVINAGGYSHTSVAIMDALLLAELPVIEVHVTNVFAREEFRHHSYVAKVAIGSICGLGIDGYAYAVRSLVKKMKSRRK
jgi:3-dehydroquinate dehydratase-2